MHLAFHTLPPAFSIHITGLFASVYLQVIKGKPLRGSRESHFSLLQESLRLAEHSFSVGPGGSMRERHFRYNAVKHPHTAVTTAKPSTRTLFISLVLFEYLTFKTSCLNVEEKSLIQYTIFTMDKSTRCQYLYFSQTGILCFCLCPC